MNCEYINHELELEDRTWLCPKCKVVHDRDENAALNLYYNEDNAKKVIQDVLLYHKNKFTLNNRLLFNVNKTQD